MLSLPSIPAPAALRLPETLLSYVGLKPFRMFEPEVLSTPTVANRSLIPSGMPESGFNELVVRSRSAASAAANASSGVSTV
jgi:hypothetical protein